MADGSEFLKNVWYMAAWSLEIGESLMRRRICDQPIVLYRLESGAVAALLDRCPHRFALLSKGERVGDAIRCGYHGLTFDAEGTCIHNPYSSTIPRAAAVRSWPVRERHGIVWLWMGDPALADATDPPDFSVTEQSCGDPMQGLVTMKAGYEFGTDNLMDLSHIEFVHKGSFAGAGVIFAGEHVVREDGDTIRSNWWMPNVKAPAHTIGIYDPEMITDHWLDMQWNAPASMLLEIGASPAGTPRENGVIIHQLHALTPETPSTAHYFWRSTRPLDVLMPDVDHMVRQLLTQAFCDEDKPMIESAFANLDGADFWSLRPVSLGIDAGGTRARRKLEQLRKRERDAGSPDASISAS